MCQSFVLLLLLVSSQVKCKSLLSNDVSSEQLLSEPGIDIPSLPALPETSNDTTTPQLLLETSRVTSNGFKLDNIGSVEPVLSENSKLPIDNKSSTDKELSSELIETDAILTPFTKNSINNKIKCLNCSESNGIQHLGTKSILPIIPKIVPIYKQLTQFSPENVKTTDFTYSTEQVLSTTNEIPINESNETKLVTFISSTGKPQSVESSSPFPEVQTTGITLDSDITVITSSISQQKYLYPDISESPLPYGENNPNDSFHDDIDSCLSKCCPMGQSFGEDKKSCIQSQLEFLPRFQSDRPLPKAVHLDIGLKCKHGRFRLEPQMDSDDEFYILTNGTLFLPYQMPHFLSCNEYCLESFLIDEEVQILPLICFMPQGTQDDSWTEVRRTLYSLGCLVSVPFLLITLLVYITCPELRTTNGKVLCCHILSLAVAYSSLSVVQIAGDTLSQTNCIIVAFTVQFSFLTSFFWLNVLCFNTWRRLKYKIRRKSHHHDYVRSKTFLYYSIYGWGAPVIFIMVTLVMDLNPSVPSSYLKPNFGYEKCWFQDETSALSYFYAPIALILVANIALFIMSAFHVWTNHKISSMGSGNRGKWDIGEVAIQVIKNRRKAVFVECLMLFLVMGLNWVWEVISWQVQGPQQLWFVTDMFNTLQGIIVFYVFIWRDRRAWRHFMKPAFCKSCRNAREPVDPRRNSAMSFVRTRRHSSNLTEARSTTPTMDPLIRYIPEEPKILTTFKGNNFTNNKPA